MKVNYSINNKEKTLACFVKTLKNEREQGIKIKKLIQARTYFY